MKNAIITIILASLLAGCATKLSTPYGQVATETDSQIFTYTDADVEIEADRVETDDTTVVIVGVKDNTGADLESIFNHAMTEIREIFKARKEIYQAWVGGR